MARKVDEVANFVFVQLIKQEPGIYDKSHPDYARRDKRDLAWERISREMNESGMCVHMYIYFIIKNIIGSKYRICLLKQCKQTITIWPVMCDKSQQSG
jgi:hypothetical protein